MEKYNIVLIDGNNLAHRNYHINKDLATTIGDQRLKTGIAFGCISSILGFSHLFTEDAKIFVVWDKGYEKRLEIHPGYKQSRRSKDWEDRDDFLAQRRLFKKLIPMMGLYQAYKDGEEADDVIGTLSKLKNDKKNRIVIITGDHDMFQLINERVHVYRPSTKGAKLYNEKEYIKEFQIVPIQIIDIMSLMGDKGDDVPGIDGIGPKNAFKIIIANPNLINEVKTGMMPKVKGVSEKFEEKILNGLENIKLANKLVTIDRNIKKVTFVNQKKDMDRFEEACETLKFRTFLLEKNWETIGSW